MANDVNINIKARDAGAKAALIAGAQAGDQLTNSLRNSGEVARGVLAAGFIQDIGRKAQQFLGSAASAAAGLEQAVGGTKAVFGDASGAIDDFAKRSAQDAGLSEAAFRDATTLIGGQLKRMTGDVDLAADASIQLVQVGADLAATYGGTTKEAVDAFAAALRGEADPAERFNLNLKISAVNAKAVELGLAKSTNEVDDNAKAQALLALVMEQSADAQGQFAREADTAAVAQQKATAQWENAKAILGQALLPVISQAANAVSTLATGFGDLPGPVQTAVAATAALGAALLVVLPRVAAAKVALAELGISARLSGTRLGGAAAAAGRLVGPIGVLVGVSLGLEATVRRLNPNIEALAVGLDEWAKTGRTGGEAAKLLGDDFDKLNEALIGAADEGITRVTATLAEGIAPFTKNVDSSLARAVERVESLDAAMAQMVQAGQAQEAAAIFEELRRRAEENGVSQEKLIQLLPNYAAAQEVANAEAQDAAEAHDDAARSARDQVVALDELADTLKAQSDPMFAVIRSQRELRDKQKAYTEAVKDFGRESPEAADALLDLTEAGFDAASAAAEAGGKFDGKLTPSMLAALEAAGLTDKQIDGVRRQLRRAGDQADRTRRDFEQIAGTYNINFQIRQFGSVPGGAPHRFLMEHGGNVGGIGADAGVRPMQSGGQSGSALGLVGEAGPELVRLPVGSTVMPTGQSMAMLGSSDGGGGDVLVQVFIGDRELEDIHKRVHRLALRTDDSFRRDAIGSRR